MVVSRSRSRSLCARTVMGWMGATLVGAVLGGRAEITGLVISDEGECVARDLRRVTLLVGEQEFFFPDVPRETDLSSLQIWAPRTGVRLLDWDRTIGTSGVGAVRCRVYSNVGAPKVGVDLIYRLTGVTWSAEYDVWVRSDLDEKGMPVSADLRGAVRLENRTAAAFSNVSIRLIAREVRGAFKKWPGFLLLDRRTPLSDAWFPEFPEEGPAYMYALPQRLNIPPRSEVTVPLVVQIRAAAIRRYTLRSDEVPLNMRDFLPLREWIVFPYTGSRGESPALPPGKVRVSVGARRERVFTAEFQRAAPGADIRVDLGLSGEVLGQRVSVGTTPWSAGYRTETYEIRILNRSVAMAVVDIEEQPPAAVGWTLVRSSLPCEERRNRLSFQCAVPPASEERVAYTVKVREPRL